MFLASLKKLPKINQIILALFFVVLVFFLIKGIQHHKEVAKINARIYEDLRLQENKMSPEQVNARIYEDIKKSEGGDSEMTEAEIKAKIYQDLMPK